MNSREMEAWLDRIPVILKPDEQQERALQEMLGSPGLAALLGLIFGSRQALYAQLSYQPLGTEDGSARAAVLQGKIQGLELFIQTVKDLGVSVTSDPGTRQGA